MRIKNIPIFLIASLLFGLKTYIGYRFIFNIEINTLLQEIIIFLNPFITTVAFFGVSIWMRHKKGQTMFITYAALLGTLIIYFNLIFHRSFTDFLTLPQLLQTSNMSDLGLSIISLINWTDIFLFIDVVIIWFICRKEFESSHFSPFKRRFQSLFLVVVIGLLTLNGVLAGLDRTQPFSRGFDREYVVKNVGLFYYHIYDVIMHTKIKANQVFADENELVKIRNYIDDEVRGMQTSERFGIAKNRNIIFISAESMQTFVINSTLHGEEITPFLNRLLNDEDTYYFENFYHQTAQGKTSDSEFLTENSLYPTSRGAVFFTHTDNTYHSLAEMLEQANYESVVFHANNETFWNREQMYEQLKVDQFYDKQYFDVNDSNRTGWGLKDKHFFDQSLDYLTQLQQPYYAKFITLTNHFPFELDADEQTLAPFNSNSLTVNNYFTTARYTDEAIERFFMQLKTSGIYDNSIIVIMGDHDGISVNDYKELGEYLNKDELTPYDHIQLQRVPFYIHIPGHGQGKKISHIAGQIDVKPTLLHLLGINRDNDIYFGNNLFSHDRKQFIAFRNGDFVSEDYIFVNDTCYDRLTAEILSIENGDEEDEAMCITIKENVETELHYSDSIIYGDLFRFVNFNK